MLESGHVILPRLFFRDWEWSDDANTVAVFLRLLIEADIVPNTWHGIEVPRGGMVSSYAKLAEKTGLSVKQVRTAIKHLEAAGYVARTTYAKCTVFSVKNFDMFQSVAGNEASSGQGKGKQVASKGQQNKKIEEDKEDKEDIYLSILDAESQNFPPTLEEIRLFAEQEKIRIDVQKFYDYYTERDWKTKNGNFIRNWKKTLQYWGETEGTPHKGKKQQAPPVSENAAAYASLILNLDEPI